MLLKIEVTEEADCTVITLSGRIILGEESSALRDAVKSLLSSGRSRLLLDVSEVTYIDSGGIGTLYTAIWVWTRNAGGEFVLANPGKKVLDLLQITKLITIAPIFKTKAEAVEHFRRKRAQEGTPTGNG
jgi:anti-sigma B factor antagonist